MHYENIGIPFVCNFALRKFYFRGRWSATPKNRGRLKKTHGLTALKSGGSSLAVGSYFQRGSDPPPLPKDSPGRTKSRKSPRERSQEERSSSPWHCVSEKCNQIMKVECFFH